MCKAPLPGYLSTATPLPARSPAMAVDLLVALGGQLVQMRGKDQEVGAGALTKVNEGGRPSGAEGPRRYRGCRLNAAKPASDAPDFGAMTYRRRAADPPVCGRGVTASAQIAFQKTTRAAPRPA